MISATDSMLKYFFRCFYNSDTRLNTEIIVSFVKKMIFLFFFERFLNNQRLTYITFVSLFQFSLF
jgi:hypothetical protein